MTSNNFDKRSDRHFKKGDKYYRFVTELFHYKFKNNDAPFNFFKPNMVAIYLSVSDKALQNAVHILNDFLIPNIQYEKVDNSYKLNSVVKEDVVFDFIESIVISVSFAYTAVEAFINSLIPSDFIFPYKDNGILKNVDCFYIQRNIPIDIKIKKVIPKALQVNFHANSFKLWRKFTDLKKYRDELIHLKKDVIINDKSTQLNFIQFLVNDVINENIISSARKLIEYISKKIHNNPTIPYEFCSEPIELSEILKYYKK